MPIAPTNLYPINDGGEFREPEFGNDFTYTMLGEDEWGYGLGYRHKVWMSNGAYRAALVLKTRVRIVVDEDEYGNPVEETWRRTRLLWAREGGELTVDNDDGCRYQGRYLRRFAGKKRGS